MAEKQGFTRGSVVISGASSGIGEACTIYLDKLGYQVFAGVRREADGEILKSKGLKRTIPIILDITDEASIAAAVDIVQFSSSEHIELAGLVNNAGIVSTGPLEFIPISELRKQLEVNVLGQIAVTQAFLPLLRKSVGRVINMGSDSGRISGPLLGPYCASKFALEALTDSLRMELQPWGIAVSIIEPGVIGTPIWGKSIEQADRIWESLPEQARELYSPTMQAVRKTASKLGQKGISPEVVAKTVSRALAAKRPKARYVVGMDARINIWLAKIMPERVLDTLIAQHLGLPKTLIS